LIIDSRGQPIEHVVYALGQLLVARPTDFAAYTRIDLSNPGALHWAGKKTLIPHEPRYTGKVVILVDEVTQSAGEYYAMSFRTALGAKVVGSTTAGADGDTSRIPLPGRLWSLISGAGVFYPDNRPTQRIGIVPDIEVRPTIAGVRAERDEVLEEALRQILGPSTPAEEIEKIVKRAAP
jgi:C-terminal processing protease CtpA/Prc